MSATDILNSPRWRRVAHDAPAARELEAAGVALFIAEGAAGPVVEIALERDSGIGPFADRTQATWGPLYPRKWALVSVEPDAAERRRLVACLPAGTAAISGGGWP